MGLNGQVVGVTRALKLVLQPTHTEHENLLELTEDYTKDDHFDAFALFQYLISRELATLGRYSSRIPVLDAIATFHIQQLGQGDIQSQMKSLSLSTIFDVLDYGSGRSNSIFP